jgi:hypothetical protein
MASTSIRSALWARVVLNPFRGHNTFHFSSGSAHNGQDSQSESSSEVILWYLGLLHAILIILIIFPLQWLTRADTVVSQSHRSEELPFIIVLILIVRPLPELVITD